MEKIALKGRTATITNKCVPEPVSTHLEKNTNVQFLELAQCRSRDERLTVYCRQWVYSGDSARGFVLPPFVGGIEHPQQSVVQSDVIDSRV